MFDLKLEPREQPAKIWLILSPLLALLGTVIVGLFLFRFLGKSPITAFTTLFITPLSSLYGITEIAVKAAPIILIAVGLAVCFQAQVWNIGAEGQFTLGAIFASTVALVFANIDNYIVLLLCLLAGILGGATWASIPAVLKVNFHTNEILTSLMLNYVAVSLLNYLVRGILQDPQGYNFPESAPFSEFASLPSLITGTRLHLGVIFALMAAVLIWGMLRQTFFGFSVRVIGASPSAANYAGIKSDRIIWLSLLISGGLAGLAGACEVLGPIGQLRPFISPGYGYAAILAAFVGRLHPLGIILSSLLMALFYVGSELLQIKLGLPLALAGVFQGIVFFFLLAGDLLVYKRIVKSQ
ncbi:sugar ABC transporter permease [Fischerella major NIES-592]|uniref:Sugar ABC transporter permease n=1 Tax=Fischerella major NIES-592 TaxID=210994 RepID=A0A1U7H603_9CYAN|nr:MULTISPECIES: ABC transporter permease [Fischerella]OKH16705.1 sugar ABC transporter permease [Fischerella major NIES-592]BAU07887.1 putative permease protein of sugar ABC transporter [Fischerella sp. NIES-3754]